MSCRRASRFRARAPRPHAVSTSVHSATASRNCEVASEVCIWILIYAGVVPGGVETRGCGGGRRRGRSDRGGGAVRRGVGEGFVDGGLSPVGRGARPPGPGAAGKRGLVAGL